MAINPSAHDSIPRARTGQWAAVGAEAGSRLEAAVDFDRALFVGTRDLVVRKQKDSILTGWRLALFAFLYRNSVKVVDRFSLAPENVIEIARQIEI